LVWFFSLLFGVLIYWLLGFVVHDIATWPGPTYDDTEKRMLEPQVRAEAERLRTAIEDTTRGIADQKQRQSVLRDSTSNSERTMTQLAELQKLTLQRGLQPAAEETAALAESERLFLENQRKYQAINEQVAALTERLRGLEDTQRGVQRHIEERRTAIREEFTRLYSRHQLKLAALKLGFLLPFLSAAVALFARHRSGTYAPLIHALGAATLVQVLVVMHAHFPRRYFKYVLIGAALLLVARILVGLLRAVAFPKRDWLLRQYREAYEHFVCPVCAYPIRRGPLKYLFWTRRSVRKLQLPAGMTPVVDEPYTCPACGTRLFDKCDRCHAIRHALLPVCAGCGAELEVLEAEQRTPPGDPATASRC
jgi:hypothetical protein